MLNVDCLLKNTDFIDGVRKYIKYLGHLHAEQGKDASFEAVYNRLKADKLEVDIETAGVLYSAELPTETDGNFTRAADVENIAGREFDETTKNLLLSKPKTGELTIGDLPPRKEIAKRIANAFNNNIIEDHRTKSILRTIQDMYTATLSRYTGELPNKKGEIPEKPFEQLFQEGLDKMNIGHRDNETGLVNNLSTLHEGVNKELKILTDKLEAEGDHVKAEQFKRHVADFQDSVYSLALTSKEAKEGVDGALRAAGFEKTNPDGTKSLDWEKLATKNNSTEQLRQHVIDALTDSGKFDKPTAEKIANSLQKEFLDKYSRMVDVSDKQQNKLGKTWEPPSKKPDVKVKDAIYETVKNWENYIGYEGRGDAPLIVSKKTAGEALEHAIVAAGLSRKIGNGDLKWDIDKLSNAITNPPDIKQIATDYFAKQENSDGTRKYNDGNVERLANAIDGMYTEVFNKVREHVEGKQAAIEKTWDPAAQTKQPTTLSDIVTKRLKEWSQYKKITDQPNAPLRFTKNEAQRIVGEALKNSEEYGKESAAGNKSVNWQKLAENRPDEFAVNQTIYEHLLKEGYGSFDADAASESLSKKYAKSLDEDIDAHAKAILDTKQAAINREAPERKTAIHRLSELHALGVFDDAREKLLYHVLGVDKANAEDIASLNEIAKTVTDIRNEVGDKSYLNSFAYQSADRIVAHLIDRNKEDKSRLIKISRMVNHTFGLMNMSLIGNPYNLVENNWSGKNALWGAKGELVKQMGLKNAKLFNDKKLWRAVWKDVAMGGVEYGGAGDKWSHIGGYVDKLNSVNFKDNPIKAIATSVILPFRALLNGSDAANKAVLHQKGMLLMLHKAMTTAGWDGDEAAHHLHEALYGENFEKAKERARDLIENYGDKLGVGKSEYAKERAATRWANDLVKANLNLSAEASLNGGGMPIKNNDIIEAAINSSFHAAAVSLGHEPNNPQSKGMKAGKQAAAMEERRLIEKGNYSGAAWEMFKNNIYWNGIRRMQAGGMNWAVLRAEGAGIGLISYGKSKTELDFTSKDTLEESMQTRISASRKMARAITGMSLSALTIAAMGGYGAIRKKEDDEEDDEGAFASGVQGIKRSYELNRLMGKAGPEWAFMYYLGASARGESNTAAVFSAIEYTQNLFNANPEFTFLGHLSKAGLDLKREKGNGKNIAAAEQEAGKILGDLVSIPLWKPFKNVYQIGMHHIAGKPIVNPYTKATSAGDDALDNFVKNAALGAVGGGAVQDLVNELSPEFVEKIGMEDWLYPEND